MKTIICGGRDYQDLAAAFHALDYLHARHPVTLVISGGARGADSLGEQWARARGIPLLVKPADWETHGKAAGYIRNQEMLSQGAEYVVAFPGGRGTSHMKRIAHAAGVPVWEPYP